jgi:mRNA interferase HicA
MKRRVLLKHLFAHGCVILREGKRHTVVVNISLQTSSTVPRHQELDDKLARKICRDLGVTEIGKSKK